jgi:hypothetical protein
LLVLDYAASGIEFLVVKAGIQFSGYLTHGYRGLEPGVRVKDASDGFG